MVGARRDGAGGDASGRAAVLLMLLGGPVAGWSFGCWRRLYCIDDLNEIVVVVRGHRSPVCTGTVAYLDVVSLWSIGEGRARLVA